MFASISRDALTRTGTSKEKIVCMFTFGANDAQILEIWKAGNEIDEASQKIGVTKIIELPRKLEYHLSCAAFFQKWDVRL